MKMLISRKGLCFCNRDLGGIISWTSRVLEGDRVVLSRQVCVLAQLHAKTDKQIISIRNERRSPRSQQRYPCRVVFPLGGQEKRLTGNLKILRLHVPLFSQFNPLRPFLLRRQVALRKSLFLQPVLRCFY